MSKPLNWFVSLKEAFPDREVELGHTTFVLYPEICSPPQASNYHRPCL